MRHKIIDTFTSIELNESYIGETIEANIERIVRNSEPITDGAPLIYTDRKDGVKAEYDIRTDRFDLAIDAMDYASRSNTAKRMQKLEKSSKEDGEAEPIQAS